MTCVLCVLYVCVSTWMDGICMCVGCEGGQVPQRSKGVCVWGGGACVCVCVLVCVYVCVCVHACVCACFCV